MSIVNQTTKAGGDAPPATVKVWDPFVRLFHWSLAGLFLLAFVTAEEIESVHNAAGYAIAGLLALRVVWGFIGPRHARFADFVETPRAVLCYLRDAALLRAPRYLGHNPAGGAMAVALIALLGATGATGYLMADGGFAHVKWLEEMHEAFANLTVGLVAVHVFGVLLASLVHRENLVKAMITGRKRAN